MRKALGYGNYSQYGGDLGYHEVQEFMSCSFILAKPTPMHPTKGVLAATTTMKQTFRTTEAATTQAATTQTATTQAATTQAATTQAATTQAATTQAATTAGKAQRYLVLLMSGISLCFGSDDVIESIGQFDTDYHIDRRCLFCRMELRVYSMGRISRNTLCSLISCVVLLISARKFISGRVIHVIPLILET